jgi:hypothetical protein
MTIQKVSLLALGLLVALIAGRFALGFRSQPQLSASDDVFKTVDSLFTAVTAKDLTRLTECQQRLAEHQARGSLPAAAARRLSRIVAAAQAGEWESAAQRLYDFMQGQRRDRTVGASPPRATAMNKPAAGVR